MRHRKMTEIITIDIYKKDVMVHFGDRDSLERELKQYNVTNLQEIIGGITSASVGRSVAVTDSGPFLLWMPRIPVTSEEFGTLSHEIFHTVCFIMKGIGAEFSDDSEEPYAYLVGYLTEKILKAFKIIFSSS